VAAAVLFAMMLVVTADVSGRYLFNLPLPAGYEMIQLMMGVLVFAALPLVSRRNEHITVGLLDHLFVGRAHRARLTFVHLCSAVVLGFLGWRLAAHTFRLAARGDATAVLQLPLAPVGWFAVALTAVSTAALLALAWRVAAGRADAAARPAP
jgi:TRAP-type C4-dicarboxylate transport system permease small subunit